VTDYVVRPAAPQDADAIAVVHRDSIWTLAVGAYPQSIMEEWGAPRTGDRYREAMGRAVRFFVVVERKGSANGALLGFSSYAVEGDMHRTAVYVSGAAGRRGIGRALFTAAEGAARDAGAPALTIEAALNAVPFWVAMGFALLGQMDHVTRGGQLMPCLLMRKTLDAG
jgi:GNAT superfamily N-acetyltransferase